MRSQGAYSEGDCGSLSSVQCFLYLVSSSINVSIFHVTWLDPFWTDLILLPSILVFVMSTLYTQPLQESVAHDRPQ